MAELTKCPGCGAEFSTYNQLIDHVVKVHNITCQVCGAKLSSKEELLEHNRVKHGISYEGVKVEEQPKSA